MLKFLALAAVLVPLAFADTRCIRAGGTCRYTSQGCNGSFRPGMCNGPANRQCCIGGGGSGDSRCTAIGGSCRLTGQGCPGGSFRPGLCTGPANRQCCARGGGGGNCAGANIISRAGWGARRPRRVGRMRTPVNMVFVHHTAGGFCSSRSACIRQMRNIQRFHMDSRRWTDIAYNWLVGEDGNVYEGRGWTATGGHTMGYNSVSVAVSYIGNFVGRIPNAAAIRAGQNIIACGAQRGFLRGGYELRGHRNAGCTSCPGNALYANIQGWRNFSRRPIRRYGCGG